MNTPADDTLDAVAASLATQPDIRLAMAFGSLAEARAGRDSDLDIAILGDPPLDAARRMQLIEMLAQLSGRPIDLIDLTTAGIAVARSAVLGGKVLYNRDDIVYPALVSRILLDSADFLPYRDRLLKERRDAWTQ